MLDTVKSALKQKINDDKLIDNLFYSYQQICEKFIAQKPVELVQNVGLFVESVLRFTEHQVTGRHTPLEDKLDVDTIIKNLEKASGPDGLRILVARLCRVVYDFRTRKKAVHLRVIDPQLIDANLLFNIGNWVVMELLKESGIPKAEDAIRTLFTRKVPLVQTVDGILRTTNPRLLGTQRIMLLLYAAPDGLTDEELLESTKQKIKNMDHLRTNLKNLDGRDLVHQAKDKKWMLFGRGFSEAERLIEKFT
jgi:hypothetical protein